MKSPRLVLAATAVCLLAALTACSGDSDSDSGSDSDAGQDAAPSGDTAPTGPVDRACTVEVTLTGVVEASWQGKGRSSNEAGPTIYQFTDGDNRMAVYAGTTEIPTNANLTAGGANYTTNDPEAGLDVAVDGRLAIVDADMVGTDGAGPHVTATFTCGKK